MSASSDARRQAILRHLESSPSPLPAQALGQLLCVSRQVIVSDIAILRERGHEILSTPRGYLFHRPASSGYEGTVSCRHCAASIALEFYTVVDLGGEVLDIRISHPVYGHIALPLHIRSRLDADRFIESMKQGQPLSLLTAGEHTHRICAPDAAAFELIVRALEKNGILSAS